MKPLVIAAEGVAPSGVLNVEIWAVVLIAIAAAVAVVARMVKAPFTVLLVVAGLVMAVTTRADITISKDLILGVFVPPRALPFAPGILGLRSSHI